MEHQFLRFFDGAARLRYHEHEMQWQSERRAKNNDVRQFVIFILFRIHKLTDWLTD